MRKLAGQVRRAGIVLLVAGAGALGLAAPAVAEPVTPAPESTEERCSDPLDGVVVCYSFIKGETPEDSYVRASVRAEEGRTLAGAMVVIEACSPDCQSQGVSTGKGITELHADARYGRGTGYYRANASWVDDQQHVHTGVTAK
ncbi:hypothetical protein ACU61A_10735 [Pseudonocardia sichuanensis]